VFDDLHWADDALLDFVDHVVDWASGVPILVLATARPDLLDRRPDWGGGRANVTALRLSPLSLEETTRLFGALFAGPPCRNERTPTSSSARAATRSTRRSSLAWCWTGTATEDSPGPCRD